MEILAPQTTVVVDEATSPRTFPIEKSFVRLMQFSVGIGIVMLLFHFGVGVHNELYPDEKNLWFTRGLCLFNSSWLIPLTYFAIKNLKQCPLMTRSVDQQGLWPAHLPRETSLVSWDDIPGIRERHLAQRLDLLGGDGRLLLKIEYQLDGFDELRDMISARMRGADELGRYPMEFLKPRYYHLLHIGCIVGFTVLCAFVAQENLLFGIICGVGIIAMICWEYFRTICKLIVHEEYIQLHYPHRKLRLLPSEISAVEQLTAAQQQVLVPTIVLTLKASGKRLKLQWLGKSNTILYRVLLAWKHCQ